MAGLFTQVILIHFVKLKIVVKAHIFESKTSCLYVNVLCDCAAHGVKKNTQTCHNGQRLSDVFTAEMQEHFIYEQPCSCKNKVRK